MTKILHLHFFGGSGGKFIANCLAMSGQVAFPNFEIFKQYFESKDISIIEQNLAKTIPPLSEHRTWLSREQGCHQLFGKGINYVRGNQGRNNVGFNDVGMFSDVWLPVCSHKLEEALKINNHFSFARIFFVGIYGDPKFIDKAIRLKWPEDHHCLDLDLFSEFTKNCEKLQFDHVIHNWNPLETSRLLEIEKLADLLNLNYSNSLAKKYINKYVQFHQPTGS